MVFSSSLVNFVTLVSVSKPTGTYRIGPHSTSSPSASENNVNLTFPEWIHSIYEITLFSQSLTPLDFFSRNSNYVLLNRTGKF